MPFWIAVVLTGVAAGVGAALLTALLMKVQDLSWGASDPAALTEAARRAAPGRHVLLLLAAGLLTGAGGWLLARFVPGGETDITEAIWFRAGRLPTIKTLGSAALSTVIVAMGAALGREGAPKHAGAAFGNLASGLQKLSDEQRRLLVAIGAGAGMAAVYSVPLGGALFALEVVRGQLALRLLLPALTATTIATKVAMFVIPDAPIYTVPVYHVGLADFAFAALAAPIIGLWSVAFVRLIAWADRSRPSGWRRILAPFLVFAAVGLVSIPLPQVLGNGQDVAQELFRQPLPLFALLVLVPVRPLCTVASVASGAPGGLFTPSLSAGALMGAALGVLWLHIDPQGDLSLYAIICAGAMLAATTQGPISSLVMMMELTGHARFFTLPMLVAIIIATAIARTIEPRSIYEARLSDQQVAERFRVRGARPTPARPRRAI
ncbi:chloride channel protein [Candidatus Rhodoblastus alkanivorans]|uniref:Chloride channel protein n=2 Tax=Candidatus Rhodoblastus alkanivorans TaxID=2954117 RepID=A0ABS9Z6T5_9HYPH|nr:chloride channel protein [Candidatus Rhodoblastus alkanivorans]MCI4683328.1 chloride channel protein [Candidatus Rhodoblastus alkanivorans]